MHVIRQPRAFILLYRLFRVCVAQVARGRDFMHRNLLDIVSTHQRVMYLDLVSRIFPDPTTCEILCKDIAQARIFGSAPTFSYFVIWGKCELTCTRIAQARTLFLHNYLFLVVKFQEGRYFMHISLWMCRNSVPPCMMVLCQIKLNVLGITPDHDCNSGMQMKPRILELHEHISDT